MKTKNMATFFAILAAAPYAINIPFSKLLLTQMQRTHEHSHTHNERKDR